MSLLVILGIWIAASVILTPVVGYFLSVAPRRAAERKAEKERQAVLHQET